MSCIPHYGSTDTFPPGSEGGPLPPGFGSTGDFSSLLEVNSPSLRSTETEGFEGLSKGVKIAGVLGSAALIHQCMRVPPLIAGIAALASCKALYWTGGKLASMCAKHEPQPQSKRGILPMMRTSV